jgi:O-antigen/teichoic acid export membrane protein
VSELIVQTESTTGILQRLRGPVARIRSLFLYLSFSSASSAVGLLTTLFLVRHVAPQEFGRLAITLGALMVANTIMGFSADNLIAINKTNLEPDAYAAFRTAYSHFALMNYVISQLVVVLVWFVFRVDDLVIFVPLMALTKFFVTMASIEYVMEQRAIAYGLIQFLTSLVAALISVALVLWVAPNAESRIAALLLADIALLVVRYGVRPKVIESWRFHREDFKRIALFGAPLMLSVGPAYLLNEGDKVIIAHQMGLASAGIYGAGYTVAGVMLTFIVALLNSTVPKIMLALKADRENASRTTIRYAIKFCGLCVAFAVIFLLAYTVAAKFILPARYAAVISTVYVVVVMMQFRAFYVVIGTVTDYFGMTAQKLWGCILGAAVSLASVFLLIHPLGLPGAACGVGLGYATLAVWLMFCLKRR